MRISRANLAAHVAAAEDNRPLLNAIHFGKKGTVSADGYRLLRVAYPTQFKGSVPLPKEGVTIPLSDCQQALRTAKQLGRDAEIDLVVADHGVTFTIHSKRGQEIVLSTPREGVYPLKAARKYERMVKPTFSVGFTLDLLESTCAALRQAGASTATLGFTSKHAPIQIEGHNGTYDVTAVLMPCLFAGDSEDLPAPAWDTGLPS